MSSPGVLATVGALHKTCRCLFGPVDHGATATALTRETKHIDERNVRKYNFDFGRETPLASGRYVWQRVLAGGDVPRCYVYDLPRLSLKLTGSEPTTTTTTTPAAGAAEDTCPSTTAPVRDATDTTAPVTRMDAARPTPRPVSRLAPRPAALKRRRIRLPDYFPKTKKAKTAKRQLDL